MRSPSGPAPDYTKVAAAYEDVLRRDSTNSTALNNLSVLYSELRRYDDAAKVLWRSLSTTSATGNNYANLLIALTALRDTADIDSVAKLFATRLPDNSSWWEARGTQLYARGLFDSSFAEARIIARTPQPGRQDRVANGWMSAWAALRGRPNESMGYLARVRKTAMAGASTGAAAMVARSDSAFQLSFWGGAPSEASAVLRRAIAPAAIADIEPLDRLWENVLSAAAYAGDTLSARVAYAGYMKDKSATQGLRTFWDARANAYLAIANEQHDEAIAQRRIASAERASPNNEEAFLDDWTQPEPAQVEVVRAVKARVAALRAKLAPG